MILFSNQQIYPSFSKCTEFLHHFLCGSEMEITDYKTYI